MTRARKPPKVTRTAPPKPSKSVPLLQRYPGKFVARYKVWTPDRGSFGFEGTIEEEVADFLMMASVAPQKMTEEMRLTLKRFTRQLSDKEAPIGSKPCDRPFGFGKPMRRCTLPAGHGGDHIHTSKP